MAFISQDSVSAILLLLLLVIITPLCDALWKTENNIKEAVFLSPKFELSPGSVVNKYFHDIEFPRGHIALKSFNGEVVDEEGNSVPLYETYLHHWAVDRYHQRKNDESDFILVRNSGICSNEVNYQHFGIGSETRGTATYIPDPFGIEVGNPEEIPEGYEEKWMLNVHAIDTRGVEDERKCDECWCDLYNVTKDEYGEDLRPDYIGGLFCCYDNTQCRLKEGFKGPKKSFYFKYTVKWVEWDHNLVVPVQVYLLDVSESLQVLNGSEANVEHKCQVEYDVEACKNKHDEECIDVKRTRIPMQKGGYVVYGVVHQHAAATGSTLYGQDGRVICTSRPRYGNGKEAGNEEGHIVGMSSCYPQPGSLNIFHGEILTLECNYTNTQTHVGVMGLFYLLLAENLPHHHLSTRSSRASLLPHLSKIL